MAWKIKGCVNNSTFSCKFEGMLHVRVPAGSRPSVLTFLSPEKNNFVRSYRSCLARDRREGRGERRVGLISLSMRTIRALRLLICMPDPVKLPILEASFQHPPVIGRVDLVVLTWKDSVIVLLLDSWDMKMHKTPHMNSLNFTGNPNMKGKDNYPTNLTTQTTS